MFTMRGKYNSANIFIDQIDQVTMSQIQSMLNHPAFADSYIAIMPDTHAGKGSVIGFTMHLNNYIIPNIVGVDIGCGIESVNLGNIDINYKDLDRFIGEKIPMGFRIHNEFVAKMDNRTYQGIYHTLHKIGLDESKVLASIGSLGGGNHFIEIDEDSRNNDKWLTIHSGSRNFGLQVAKYHQQKAKDLMKKMFIGADAYRDSEFLPLDNGGQEYLDDMAVSQGYAQLNRDTMFNIILEGYFQSYEVKRKVSSVHNYINFEDRIIRKGAIQAKEGQDVIIPFNMRDGVAICRGKGNKKYNYSAPHGAGRIMSRTKAKAELSLDTFKKQMEGVFSTTVKNSTLDESPDAYKDMNIILENIKETVELETLMKPVYNRKAT